MHSHTRLRSRELGKRRGASERTLVGETTTGSSFEGHRGFGHEEYRDVGKERCCQKLRSLAVSV